MDIKVLGSNPEATFSFLYRRREMIGQKLSYAVWGERGFGKCNVADDKMGKIMRLEMVIYFYSKHFFGLFSSGYAENKLVEP